MPCRLTGVIAYRGVQLIKRSRGKNIFDGIKFIMGCVKGIVQMDEVYYGTVRGGNKGREREDSRWIKEQQV